MSGGFRKAFDLPLILHSIFNPEINIVRLVAILYELLCPGKKFCASFFQLSAALLESCAASAEQGRRQCADAAVDLAMMTANAVKIIAEEEQIDLQRSCHVLSCHISEGRLIWINDIKSDIEGGIDSLGWCKYFCSRCELKESSVHNLQHHSYCPL